MRTTHQRPFSPIVQKATTGKVGAAPSSVADLLRQRRSGDGKLSPAVMAELESMGEAAIPGLIIGIEKSRLSRCLAAMGWLTAAITVWILSRYLTMPQFLILSFLNVWILLKFGRSFKCVDLPVVRALIQLGNVRSLGALIGVYNRVDNALVKLEMHRYLTQMLPRLNYADRDLLQEDQRRILRGILDRSAPGANRYVGEPDEFIIAVVKALVQIGDLESLPVLRRQAWKAPLAGNRRIAALGVEELEARIAAGEVPRS